MKSYQVTSHGDVQLPWLPRSLQVIKDVLPVEITHYEFAGGGRYRWFVEGTDEHLDLFYWMFDRVAGSNGAGFLVIKIDEVY